MTDKEKINALSYALGLLIGIINDLKEKKLLEEKHFLPLEECERVIKHIVYGIDGATYNGSNH